MDWLRWYNGTATDPKWRVIAKRAGVPLHMVLAVWPFVLENANQGKERGTLDGFDCEDVAAALDLEPEQVRAIIDAMQGKVLDGDTLTGWERRNPKRERDDHSTDRVRRYRERKQEERQETPCNASETPCNGLEESREEESNTTPLVFPPDEQGGNATKRAKRAKKPATDPPETIEPTEAHRRKAEERGVDLAVEVQKCLNHHRAKGNRYADWGAVLHTWLDSPYLRPSAPPGGGSGPAPVFDEMPAWLAVFDRPAGDA